MKLPSPRRSACAVALWALLAAVPALAQSDAAGAEQLYKEAKALTKQGKYAEACPKFEESYRLDKGLGTLVNLADCHEHIGKIATAWAEWNEAADFAKREGDKRQKLAVERRDKLEPRLPKLKIEVKNPVATLAVYRGDIEVGSAAYGTALSVDPGEISVSVRRGDKTLKTEQVTAKEAETASVTLDLAAVDKEFPPPKVETPTSATSPAGASTAAPRPKPPPPPSGQKTLGFVVGGVGVAALITAGVLEVVALGKKSKADQADQCLNNYCSPNGIDTIDSAKRYANIGQWVGVGGVLLTAVGVTLVVSAPAPTETAKRSAPRAAFSPWVGPTGGGLWVSGAL